MRARLSRPLVIAKGCWRSIFRSPVTHCQAHPQQTTPSSALHGAKKIPRMCNARTHGQTQVTPEMLGYACAQARTLISTSDRTHKDGKYNYEKLFANVVELFEADEADTWAVETLEWLTRQRTEWQTAASSILVKTRRMWTIAPKTKSPRRRLSLPVGLLVVVFPPHRPPRSSIVFRLSLMSQSYIDNSFENCNSLFPQVHQGPEAQSIERLLMSKKDKTQEHGAWRKNKRMDGPFLIGCGFRVVAVQTIGKNKGRRIPWELEPRDTKLEVDAESRLPKAVRVAAGRCLGVDLVLPKESAVGFIFNPVVGLCFSGDKTGKTQRDLKKMKVQNRISRDPGKRLAQRYQLTEYGQELRQNEVRKDPECPCSPAGQEDGRRKKETKEPELRVDGTNMNNAIRGIRVNG
ncbi:hypothetical protein B0H14DRAFT_2572560 [Mycena olivaceomarginata]|nr:hypothetical protein B0H14DRAFT_2572560 [Mycena olivaceomarginata]